MSKILKTNLNEWSKKWHDRKIPVFLDAFEKVKHLSQGEIFEELHQVNKNLELTNITYPLFETRQEYVDFCDGKHIDMVPQPLRDFISFESQVSNLYVESVIFSKIDYNRNSSLYELLISQHSPRVIIKIIIRMVEEKRDKMLEHSLDAFYNFVNFLPHAVSIYIVYILLLFGVNSDIIPDDGVSRLANYGFPLKLFGKRGENIKKRHEEISKTLKIYLCDDVVSLTTQFVLYEYHEKNKTSNCLIM